MAMYALYRFALKNDVARLIVTPLGCGGWISNPLLGPPSLLVDANGLLLLIDAGEGVYSRLKRCGFSLRDINYILISHIHGDHLLGLPTLAVRAKMEKLKLSVLGPANLDLLKLFGAVGIPHYLEALDVVKVEPAPNPTLIVEKAGVKVYATLADHTVPSLAYKVEVNGSAVVFSGDTRPCASIVELARGSKMLVHEVTGGLMSEDVVHEHGHSTVADAVRIAEEAGVAYLMPFHFYENPLVLESTRVKIVLPTPCTPVDIFNLP